MPTMKVRRFTRSGLLDVAVRHAEIRAGERVDYADLLTDDSRTEVVSPAIEVEVRPFSNRMEVARFFADLLSSMPRDEVEKDAGLWTWLAWAWMDELAPVKKGVRKPGAGQRWVLAVDDWKRYYRHLFAGPYFIYKAHEDDPHRADAVLCGSVAKPGEVVEQVSARLDLVRSPGLIEAITKLYVDRSTMILKKGASGKGAGAARRLGPVLMQLDRTWDIYSLGADEVIGLLPREFDGFKPSAVVS